MELLRDTRMSVTEISAALGYSAPAHFARAFRKAVGISPHAFKRHHSPKVAAYGKGPASDLVVPNVDTALEAGLVVRRPSAMMMSIPGHKRK